MLKCTMIILYSCNLITKQVRHSSKPANKSRSLDNNFFSAKIQVLTGEILGCSDTVTGHL